MPVTIKDGWMFGSLRDDTGKEWPIEQSRQSSRGPMIDHPILLLHTTETDHLVGELQFPSNFQCGDGRIVQHIRLGFQGDAVLEHDAETLGIEMVGRSQLGLWLPEESTLGPTVALCAWLDETDRVPTARKRPNPDWPVVLDRLPAAVSSYYRRRDGTWRSPGVYGHVECPDNSHWDPGSFNYPKFFGRVELAIEGGDVKDSRVDAMLQAVEDYNQGKNRDPDMGPSYDKVYTALKDAASKPRPDSTSGITETAARGIFAEIDHGHAVKGTTTSP